MRRDETAGMYPYTDLPAGLGMAAMRRNLPIPYDPICRRSVALSCSRFRRMAPTTLCGSLQLRHAGSTMKRALPSLAASLLTALCSLSPLAAPSLGQSRDHDTVVIEGKKVLEGIWRFPPSWGSALIRKYRSPSGWVPLKGAEWRNKGPEFYCRIASAEPKFIFNCFGYSVAGGQATLDENGYVSLSSQPSNSDDFARGAYWVFKGRLSSNTELSGHMGMAIDGLLEEQPELLTVTKLVLSSKSPDPGGQAPFLKRLLEEMANGGVTEPYVRQRLFSSNPDVVPIPDDGQQLQLAFLTPDILRPLGKILAVIYVSDYVPIWGRRRDSTNDWVLSNEQSNLYDVEFEHGERLCALHCRPDGVLSQFRCI
jgi:hypothetical protein